jgi:hypothetical protein
MPIDFNKLANVVAEKVRERIEAMTDEEREEWIKKQKEKNDTPKNPSSSDQFEE